MTWFFYNFSIFIFKWSFKLASLFSSKLKKRERGLSNQKQVLGSEVDDKHKIFIHCASLGEYEMIVPLANKLLKELNNLSITFTFFSPSGYENAQILPKCKKLYLPFDTKGDVEKFLSIYKPDVFIFVKYEFWFSLLHSLLKSNTPYLFLNCSHQTNSFLFSISAFQKLIQNTSLISCTNRITAQLFNNLGCKNLIIHKDFRYLKAAENAKENFELPRELNSLIKTKVVVCGSTWEKDESFIKFISQNTSDISWIIAPHDVSQKRIKTLQNNFTDHVLWSKISDYTNQKFIIIDTIGILKHLYRIADLSIIGGGFSKGIHNIIEASISAKPIMFGPNYKRDNEAKILIKNRKAYCVKTHRQGLSIFKQLMANQKNQIQSDTFEALELEIDKIIVQIKTDLKK